MKSVYFTEDHELFRRTVREFMQSEVAPHADEWEKQRRIPRGIWKRMGESGLLGITFPEELGGAGGDVFHALAFLEELPRSRMGGFVAAVTVQQFIATAAIRDHGSPEQKERYLIPSIAGEKVGSISISEPDAGSDVASMRTRAVRDGDDWVIDGAKMWITNGVYGDFNVVACRTGGAGAGGISLIVVDAGAPGMKATALNKIGWHSSDTAEIAFDAVRVPLGNLVGRENQGFHSIMETFAIERIAAAATAIGACDVALEETLEYMAKREAFGRPINRFQALRHRVADLRSEIEAVRQLVYHAAWLHQQGESAVREAAMAKLLATELNKRVADECLQFFGGFGYTDEYPISRFYRDARVSTIVAGTSEIMREIVARTDIDGVVFDKPELPEVEAAAAPQPEVPAPMPETLPELFRSLPSRLRPEKTEGWQARFHFKFSGSEHPEWTVVVSGTTCEVEEGLQGEGDCVVSTSEAVYLDIERGKKDPQMAFMTGKIRVSNLAAMMRYIKSFRPLFTK